MKRLTLLPPAFRVPLRRIRQSLWCRVDDLVMWQDLRTYVAPAIANAMVIDITEPADPASDIAQINSGLNRTARRFLQRGYRLFVCRVDGVAAGYLWAHDSKVVEQHPSMDRLEISLGNNDIYLFNFFVRPEYRRGGVASAFFAGTLKLLRDLGYRRAFGFVDWNNIPARWLYSSHGWQPVNRLTGVVLARSILLSNRGRYYSSSLLGLIFPRFRRVVPEYLPVARKTRELPPEALREKSRT